MPCRIVEEEGLDEINVFRFCVSHHAIRVKSSACSTPTTTHFPYIHTGDEVCQAVQRSSDYGHPDQLASLQLDDGLNMRVTANDADQVADHARLFFFCHGDAGLL